MQTARQPSPNAAPSAPREVVGLIRVSTADQARDDRAGIARQRRVIEDTIQRKNLRCRRIYEIQDCSGTDVLRNPDIQEILRIVSNGGVGLVLADLDRLFRPSEPSDYKILQVFKDSGSIIFSGDTEYDLANKDSALFANIRSAISGYELQLIKERAHGAKEAKRRAGKCPTNELTLPLGLSFDRQTEKWSWNERARDVIEIFRSFLEDTTTNYSELGRRFNLTSATIRNILSRPLYSSGDRTISQKRGEKRISRTGKAYRAKVNRAPEEVINAKIVDPIIPIEQFNLAQQRIAETRFNHHENRKCGEVFNYGAGVARCGHCSEIFLYSSGKRRSGQRGSQVFCKRNYYLYRDKLGGCQQPNLRSRDTDFLIEKFTTRILRNAETLTQILDQSLQRTRQVVHPFPQTTIESQLTVLHQKSKRILDAYEGGALTLEELRTRREALKTQIASLQRRPDNQEPQRDIPVEEFARKVVRGAFRFKRMTDRKEKKAIILSLFSEIYVKDRSIIAFKFREDFGTDNQVKLGAGFSMPPIHLPEPFTLEPADPLPKGMRRCSCCRKISPAADFYPRKGQCRACIAVKAHEAYLRRRTGPASAN
jgi:site-specific DNA recombinase